MMQGASHSEQPRHVVHEGRFLRFVQRGRWEYVERVGVDVAVILVAVTPARCLLLVEQFRIPMAARVLELPAGLVGDEPGQSGEEAVVAARRELLEETGYEADSFELKVQGPATSGLTNEQIAFVVARGLRRVHAGGGVEGEDIVVHEVPLDDVPAWLKRREQEGVIIDPKIFAGLWFAHLG